LALSVTGTTARELWRADEALPGAIYGTTLKPDSLPVVLFRSPSILTILFWAFPELTFPVMEKAYDGELEPTPTFPVGPTTNLLLPTFSTDEYRFVLDAVVAKKFVVVAEVPVAFTKVKFCRVVLPVARMVLKLVAPVNEFVPEKVLLSPRRVDEADDAPQPEHEPTTRVPMFAVLALRSVVEARPDTYREVVVALVVVELIPVKF
jgi:hypothetical protein